MKHYSCHVTNASMQSNFCNIGFDLTAILLLVSRTASSLVVLRFFWIKREAKSKTFSLLLGCKWCTQENSDGKKERNNLK